MRIQLFGERCSGTNFVQTLVAHNADVEFTNALGFKHNFPGLTNEQIDLVIVCARHPYNWAQSLYQTPWGAWETYSGLSFDEFLRTPWRSKYDEYDMGVDSSLIGSESQADWDPELLRPYANPLKLRSGKYRAWLSLSSRYPVQVVQLETAQLSPVSLLTTLEEYGCKIRTPFMPCPFYKGREHLGHYAPRVYGRLSDMQADWIRSQLDLEVESELGYSLKIA